VIKIQSLDLEPEEPTPTECRFINTLVQNNRLSSQLLILGGSRSRVSEGDHSAHFSSDVRDIGNMSERETASEIPIEFARIPPPAYET